MMVTTICGLVRGISRGMEEKRICIPMVRTIRGTAIGPCPEMVLLSSCCVCVVGECEGVWSGVA